MHLRADRCSRRGASPGVTRSVVYFWVGAPRAHCGNVMRREPWSSRSCAISGSTQSEAWAASMNRGERG
eukprot:1626289-Pleurochrysis_carterae.AAC.16